MPSLDERREAMKRLGFIAVTVMALLGANRIILAQEYRFRVVASDLARPVGIASEGSETLYFTEIPTPEVPGANGVFKLDLEDGTITTLHMGEPEPTNIG